MNIFLSVTLSVLSLAGWACSGLPHQRTDSINKFDEHFGKEIVQIRRTLHQHPELAGHETQTKTLIVDYLVNLGLSVETDKKSNGVIAVLETGKKGKNIAWRADMDALPMDLNEDVDFRSLTSGVSHGCGHDAHIAIALGIAKALSAKKNTLKGTIYFIFQPEEETFRGAKTMLASSVMSNIMLDEIYALHVTALPVGQIVVRENEIFAYQRRVNIQFDERVSVDRIKQATDTMTMKLSRRQGENNPANIQQISDSILGLASPQTIFGDYRLVDQHFSISEDARGIHAVTYIYETDREKIATIIPTIKQLLKESGLGGKVRSVDFLQENITIQNDPRLTKQAMRILKNVHPATAVNESYGQVPYFNDDFAYFQQQIPGVYFLLGASAPERGIIAMNHSPNFQIDERCLHIGITHFAALLKERASQ